VKSTTYHSFLLRIWCNPSPDHPDWRASLEDPRTRQVVGFNNLEALTEYLKQHTIPSKTSQKFPDLE